MVRSAAVLVALSILAGSAVAQEATPPTTQGTHTVVDHDTLWDLAQHYLTDPWAWPRIYDANRDRVEDPDLILPGWVLIIPGLEGEGTVTEIAVEPSRLPTPQRVDPSLIRTVFYQDTSSVRQTIEGLAEVEYAAVSRDQVYSAPWLIPLFQEPEHTGVLGGRAGDRLVTNPVISGYERVRITVQGAPPRVGDLLQVFRVSRTIPELGQVVSPTGVITVSELNADGVVGIVSKQFDLVRSGDLVRPMPRYEIQTGQRAEAVSGGSEAVILGFAGRAELRDLGSLAFLDIGADDGVSIGDVFARFDRQAGASVIVGRLRVIGLTPQGATAEVFQLEGPIFDPGVVVQLTRKMR